MSRWTHYAAEVRNSTFSTPHWSSSAEFWIIGSPGRFCHAGSQDTDLSCHVHIYTFCCTICDHNPPMLQTDRQTDGRHARSILHRMLIGIMAYRAKTAGKLEFNPNSRIHLPLGLSWQCLKSFLGGYNELRIRFANADAGITLSVSVAHSGLTLQFVDCFAPSHLHCK